MFKNIKLKNVSWLVTLLLIVAGLTLVGSIVVLRSNVDFIQSTWMQYQADRSEKARLESSLRSSIGYGGMIHDFKNYILRQDPAMISRVSGHIGAANGVLRQYAALQLNQAEKIALEDIGLTLKHYDQALERATGYIAQGMTICELDKLIRVDDSLALRGLEALKYQVGINEHSVVLESKGQLVTELRAALGFGGMIHEFKNFIIRQDMQRVEIVAAKIQSAQEIIQKYLGLQPTSAEIIALEDILATLARYKKALDDAVVLIQGGAAPVEVDRVVQVDDSGALRGFSVIDYEVASQIDSLLDQVGVAFISINHLGNISTAIVVCCIATIILFLFWLIRIHVIKPIQTMVAVMDELTEENFEVEVPYRQQGNEIGHMANSIEFLKQNSIERKAAESNLSVVNSEMSQQLEEIKLLREQAELQAKSAMSFAEKLAVAREEVELAMTETERQSHYVRSVLDTVLDAVITISREGIIETFNPGAELIFGYKSQESIGRNISMLMSVTDRENHDRYLHDFFAGKSTRLMGQSIEKVALKKDGTSFPVEITVNTLQIDGETKFTGVVRDITDRKNAEEEIRRLALHDSLTGLANRRQFELRFDDARKFANRANETFALLLLDLDKFKPVNDTYGHHVGDEVLRSFSQLLQNCFRDTDTVARMGGDEFSIIVTAVSNRECIDIPVQRLLAELSQPMQIEGHSIQIGASVGVSFYPDDSRDQEELFQQADKALYRSKNDGRNTFTYFNQL